ncbi:MAG: SusD/RagB family nutrient-binding outer membrane lipoprotein [Bacteroidetes bacterium]|nr:SusD/RagB family nutrient-binding outer membrane lipoprotein [Bacteroidota bacterium]
MKKNILIIITGLVLLGTSCSKDFLNVNEKNPNGPSVVASKLILPAAINGVANTMNLPRRFDFVYLWHGLWSVSAGYSQPQNLVQYKLINQNYQNAFLELYTTAKNFDVIEKASTDPKDLYFLAISKIMKAYIFQNLVDCWGDVPYTDAFKTDEGNLKPKYDKQKDIYEDLVVQLDAAMTDIQSAALDVNVVPASSDIMFGGDMTKWLKFANTLKLRILIHQSGMEGRASYITENIAATASIGYLGAGESALVNPGFVVSQGKMNPFYETFYNSAATSQSDGTTYYFAGKDAVDFYQSNNDPRISKFFQTYDGTHYEGNYFGHLPADLIPQAKTSKLGYAAGDAGTMIGTPTKSAPILTDFESLFLQAEAVQRGFMSGDAKAFYEGAITQSFSYMGLSGADAASFLSQQISTVNFDNSTNKLELILTQKWGSLNGISPVEIWTDYRRSGFPTGLVFSVDPAKAGPGYPPVRLLYPQDEINVNNDNVLAVGTIDPFTSKIFWQNR